jgi:hypothetical protein
MVTVSRKSRWLQDQQDGRDLHRRARQDVVDQVKYLPSCIQFDDDGSDVVSTSDSNRCPGVLHSQPGRIFRDASRGRSRVLAAAHGKTRQRSGSRRTRVG